MKTTEEIEVAVIKLANEILALKAGMPQSLHQCDKLGSLACNLLVLAGRADKVANGINQVRYLYLEKQKSI